MKRWLVILIILISACRPGSQGNGDFKQNSQELLKMSDLIDTNSVQTIILETTDENLISYVKQIVVTEKYLFVLNKVPSEIIMFDKNGKFIRKIGYQGRGAGEYLQIRNIYVDESKKEIISFDSENCKIFIYGYNGDFIRTISNKNNPYGQVARLNDTLYCLNNNSNKTKIDNNPAILILNDKGELIKSFHPRIHMEGKRNVIPIAVGPAFFAENATGKYYVPLGSDTIFHLSVTDKEVVTKPVLCLGIEDYFFPPDISQKEYNKNVNRYFDPFQALVVNDYGLFYGEVVFQGKIVSIFGDLTKGMNKVGIVTGDNDVWPVLVTPQASYKDYFVDVVDGSMAREYRNNYFNVPEGSNPVVVLFKFKTDQD